MNAYLLFVREVRAALQEENPRVSKAEIHRVAQEKWQKKSSEEKRSYFDRAEKLRQDTYQKQRGNRLKACIDAASTGKPVEVKTAGKVTDRNTTDMDEMTNDSEESAKADYGGEVTGRKATDSKEATNDKEGAAKTAVESSDGTIPKRPDVKEKRESRERESTIDLDPECVEICAKIVTLTVNATNAKYESIGHSDGEEVSHYGDSKQLKDLAAGTDDKILASKTKKADDRETVTGIGHSAGARTSLQEQYTQAEQHILSDQYIQAEQYTQAVNSHATCMCSHIPNRGYFPSQVPFINTPLGYFPPTMMMYSQQTCFPVQICYASFVPTNPSFYGNQTGGQLVNPQPFSAPYMSMVSMQQE